MPPIFFIHKISEGFMKKLLLLFLPLVFIANEGCLDIPDDIIMPQWDVELNVPLMKRFYKFHEIIKTQDYISLDDDSTYVVTSDVYNQTSDVSKFIEVNTESANEGQSLSVQNPSQVFLAFPEDAKLKKGKFVKGTLRFAIHNDLISVNSLKAIITLPGVKDSLGSVFVAEISAAAGQSNEESFDLPGYTFEETLEQTLLGEGGKLHIKVKSESDNQFATGTFDSYSSNFLFNRALGYLPTKSLGMLNNTFDLKIGDASDFRDKIALGGAVLNLKSFYTTPEDPLYPGDPFPIEIRDLIITGKRKDGTTIRMKEKDPATGAVISEKFTFRFEGGVIDTNFTEQNSTVTEFLSFMPDSVLLDAEYIMNPDNDLTYHVATDEDKIDFETFFTSRLTNNKASLLSLKQSTVIDTTDIDFSDDDRDQIANGQLANLTMEVESFLPVTSSLHIIVTDKNYSPLFVASKNSNGTDTLTFNGGNINTATGRVASSTTTNQTINLTADEIEKLSKAYYAIVTTGVRTKGALDPDPPKVALRANDWIRIKVFGSLNYRIKEKD